MVRHSVLNKTPHWPLPEGTGPVHPAQGISDGTGSRFPLFVDSLSMRENKASALHHSSSDCRARHSTQYRVGYGCACAINVANFSPGYIWLAWLGFGVGVGVAFGLCWGGEINCCLLS